MTGFKLNEEQRERVRDCLPAAQISLIEPLDRFVSRIEASIDHFLAAEAEGTLREAHDALRRIWLLSHDDDPSPGQLRALVKSLPTLAIEHMARRATRVIPELFPGEMVDGEVFEPSSRLVGRFLSWIEGADRTKLIAALRALSAAGAQPVRGRRSADRIEPHVLGVTRGSPQPKPVVRVTRGSSQANPKGGRPTETARHDLVMNLAGDWRRGTGQMPEKGRGDKTGFGNLVHSVFQWVVTSKETYEAATYALRRFWEHMEEREKRSSLADFLRRYGEEF